MQHYMAKGILVPCPRWNFSSFDPSVLPGAFTLSPPLLLRSLCQANDSLSCVSPIRQGSNYRFYAITAEHFGNAPWKKISINYQFMLFWTFLLKVFASAIIHWRMIIRLFDIIRSFECKLRLQSVAFFGVLFGIASCSSTLTNDELGSTAWYQNWAWHSCAWFSASRVFCRWAKPLRCMAAWS